MAVVELTFDAWEVIVDILAGPAIHRPKLDTRDVRNLCLTCKALVPLCQRQLFSILELRDYSEIQHGLPGLIDRFHALITRNPKIIFHVRHLRHTISLPDDARLLEIFNILHEVSALQSIALWSPNKKWDEYPRPFQIALEKLIQLPTVNKVKLSDIGPVPSSIFHGSKSITYLALRRGVDFADSNDVQAKSIHDIILPRVQYLCVGDDLDSNALSYLAPAGTEQRQQANQIVKFGDLQGIEFDIGIASNMYFVYQILQLSKAIQVLEITTYGMIPWTGLGNALLSLGSTQTVGNLRKLTLKAVVLAGVDNALLSGLVSELKMIAGMNILEEISLDVTFDANIDYRLWHMFRSACTAFDSALTTPGSFPEVKVVTMRIVWEMLRRFWDDTAPYRVLDTNFPNLLRSNTVEFRFSARTQAVHDGRLIG